MRMEAVRAARGLQKVTMANLLGLSPQRLHNYEGGRSTPPPDVLMRFWQLTGATADYVLFGQMTGMPVDLVTLLQQHQSKARDQRSAAAG